MIEPLHEAVINILKVFCAYLKLGVDGEHSKLRREHREYGRTPASSFREKNSSRDC